MLRGGRVDRTRDPWCFEAGPGSMAWSDASGVTGSSGWAWGGVIRFAGRDDVMLVHGECPTWVQEATTAEIWGMVESARLIVKEKGAHATVALVCDNTHAVFAVVALLRKAVPPACQGPARDAAEAVLRAAKTGVGDEIAAARAKAALELASLGTPTILRCSRETPELQTADELARLRGGFKPRRDSVVQRSQELRHVIYR